jgi:PAS domain S-box-containing protein
VEDDPAHAELASRALESVPSEHELHTVETLGDARRWLRKHTPDLVVSDLGLPDGSAIELLAEELPLVIMTSQGDEQRAVASMKGGALDYVVKSAEMYRELSKTVERALRASRAERERRRAEASLRESEERFRQLADNIQEAFWLYDIRARSMVYVSPAWSRVYGQSVAAVLDDPSARFEAVHPEDRKRVTEAFDAEAPSRPIQQEYRVLTGDSVRWVAERTFPIEGSDGRPWRIAGLGADVTRRRELEGALRQSQKMEAIGQLAGGVAHDFNNMLTAIMAAAEQLGHLSSTEEQLELCELVVSAAERTAQLTRKLLSFSRKGKLRSVHTDVHTVIQDTATLLGRSIDRRVKIIVELSAPSATVIGDASELSNAILNLGINARDAMPNGGELHITSSHRDLDEASCATMPFLLRPGPYIQVSVRDTGAGISQEHLPRVFEPFFTTKPVGQGTGLGLAAVYGTVVDHGGAVTVYSELGRGTVFHLYLPLSDGAPRASSPTSEAPRGSGLVLIVDDEPLVRNAGTQLLKSLGYEVVVAKDGAEGVRAFAEHHERLCAVLCDLVMPELSGSDASEQMRRIDPDVPIVICSGYPRDERGPYAASANEFLPKPYHRGELADLLARVARRVPALPN